MYIMYCELDDAYNTASDLLQSQKNCVYDNIIHDDDSIIEQCKPKNIFTAQGDFKPFESLEETYGFNSNVSNELTQFGGTTIDNIQTKTPNTNNANTETKSYFENKNTITQKDEEKIRHIVNESFNDIMKKNKPPNSHELETRKKIHKIFTPEIRDGVILTFVGVLILFLLDILVRISKNLF